MIGYLIIGLSAIGAGLWYKKNHPSMTQRLNHPPPQVSAKLSRAQALYDGKAIERRPVIVTLFTSTGMAVDAPMIVEWTDPKNPKAIVVAFSTHDDLPGFQGISQGTSVWVEKK